MWYHLSMITKEPSIETWHIYWRGRPFNGSWMTPNYSNINDKNFVFEIQQSIEIRNFLEKLWNNPEIFWFHDDILPRIAQKTSEDTWRCELFIQQTAEFAMWFIENQHPNTPISRIQEYDLINEACKVSIPEVVWRANDLLDWQYDEEKSTVKWPRIKKWNKNVQQKIRLMWYRNFDDIPSCEILDYTFYKMRLSQTSPTITLIHENMKSQQSKVQKLFEIMWEKPEVIVLFHDGTSITERKYWWENIENEELWEVLVKHLNKSV